MGLPGPCRHALAEITLSLWFRRPGGSGIRRPDRVKGQAMKIKVTRTPTITKAAIATVVFTIVFLATNSNLPSCSDAVAALNADGCIVRQSYLHTACGWLALASLITGVVLFILKQRRTSSAGQQAPSRPAWSGAPSPAEAPRPAETPAVKADAEGYPGSVPPAREASR
jgi:hypothetical protein